MDNDLNEEELLKQEEYKRNLFGEKLYYYLLYWFRKRLYIHK